MRVLLFTHKNDIDGMGNVVLAKLAFDNVDYVLCGTFDLTKSVLEYYESGKIYDYDKIFATMSDGVRGVIYLNSNRDTISITSYESLKEQANKASEKDEN